MGHVQHGRLPPRQVDRRWLALAAQLPQPLENDRQPLAVGVVGQGVGLNGLGLNDPRLRGRQVLRDLAGAPIEELQFIRASSQLPITDTFSLQLHFADGSIGTVHYFANGHRSFPKERLEVFASGRVLRLDNHRSLRAWGIPGFRPRHLWRQDKGQLACATAFVRTIETGGPPPIPVNELFEVQRRLLRAEAS